MTLNRRQLLLRGAAVLAAVTTPRLFAAPAHTLKALADSELIYLTPLHGDGRESTCQGEVWYVLHNDDIFVSTRRGAWRAQAVAKGLNRARIWVGEFGMWRSANGAYRSAPQLEIEGRLETDSGVQGEVLKVFGGKYASEWDKWGPRFHDGLADGSRVLLRYSIAS